jgi:hypothetical protein
MLTFPHRRLVNALIPSKGSFNRLKYSSPGMSRHSNDRHGTRRPVSSSKGADLSDKAPSTGNAPDANKPIASPLAIRMANDFNASRQSDVDKWRIKFPTCEIVDDAPLLLPEIREEDRGKKCLVLDLDDTLIYPVYSKDREDADIRFKVEVRNESKCD